MQAKNCLAAAVLAALSLSHFTGCSKKDSGGGATAPRSTDLHITFKDVSGAPVANAAVSLYGSESSWQLEIGALRTATTGSDGIAKFTGLSSARYWWLGKKGC